MRTQIIASVVIAGVFITMVLVANGSNKARTDTTTLPASTTTTPTGSTPASSTATTASTTASTSSTATAVGLPSVASCVAAWNGGKSATHRHVLDLRVQQDPARAAVIASYRGRNALLARDGGGSQVALTSGVCIVIAHHSVFVQQPNHNWGLVKAAAPYPFAAIVTTPHWAATRANATITVGPLGSPSANAGAVTARGGQLVVLSTSDLGNPAG